MWRLAVILVLGLGACAPRGPLMMVPEANAIGTIRPVFVATNRAAGVGDERSPSLKFTALDISVPPNRQAGTIKLARGRPDPETDFLVTRDQPFSDARAFSRGIRAALSKLPARDREVVIYVHGFNNTFAEGVLRLAQLDHDLDLPGVAVHFSWPSSANPLGYAYDHDSVLYSRDALEALLDIVDDSGARRVTLVAHSIGSMLAMETLRQMAIARPGSVARRLEGVVLVSPDIDVDVFRSQAARIGDLPESFVIFTSQNDRALRLSARLTGQPDRLGNIADPQVLGDLRVTLLDVTAFSEGVGHFVPGSSPLLIQLLGQVANLDAAFDRDRAGRVGLLPGTVLTIQNMTSIILSPVVRP